jgi:hypothetical protein
MFAVMLRSSRKCPENSFTLNLATAAFSIFFPVRTLFSIINIYITEIIVK